MVALTPRFTLLASLSAIAAFAFFPSVDGLAIQSRRDGSAALKNVLANSLGGVHVPESGPLSRRSSKPRHHHRHSSYNKVILNGDHGHIKVGKRGEEQNVAGTIKIVSAKEGSPGETIATLTLASKNGTESDSREGPFILNASGSNSTQVYLVPSPAGTNQTQPSDGNSTSTPYQTVAVRVAEDSPSGPYCATFDPNPPSPAPLTAEKCTNGTRTDAHKSQVFAFEPESGTIRPMWYSAEDADSDADDQDDDQDAGDTDSDNSGYDSASSFPHPTGIQLPPRVTVLLESPVLSVRFPETARVRPRRRTRLTRPTRRIQRRRSIPRVSFLCSNRLNRICLCRFLYPFRLLEPIVLRLRQLQCRQGRLPIPQHRPTTPAAKFVSITLSGVPGPSSGVSSRASLSGSTASSSSLSSPSASPTVGALDVEVYNPYLSSTTASSFSSSATPTVTGSASANVNTASSSSVATSSVTGRYGSGSVIDGWRQF